MSVLRASITCLVLLTAIAVPVNAKILTGGDVNPGGTALQPDPWAAGEKLYVGESGIGTMTVQEGSQVSNQYGYIGREFESTGEATVTDSGSQWNNSNDLYVGDSGSGTLNVESGGVVANINGYIAGSLLSAAGSTGVATVTGLGSQWNNSAWLYVGFRGTGTLYVTDGGAVSNVAMGQLGIVAGSTGTAKVNGAGSQWNSGMNLYVGLAGSGTLNVMAGGVVTNRGGSIGYGSSSTGTAMVTGSGSQWNNSGSLSVGGSRSRSGGDGTLNLYDSGLVTVADTTKLWSTGTISLDGGTLDTGTLDLTEGTFSMIDGELHADNVMGDLNNQAGTLTPGNSPGILSITGGYAQGTAATLEIELGGTTAGEQHDQLDVAGTVNLDGTLDLLPLASYTDPATRGTADDFTIITAGERSGTFSTVQYEGSTLATDFGPDANGSFRNHQGDGRFRNVTYTATTVQLQNLLAHEGDSDGDQDVDSTDFNSLATHFDPDGATAPHSWTEGNFDGDDDIDITDFNFLAANFAPDGYGASAVPESSSLLLTLLGLMLLAGARVQ